MFRKIYYLLPVSLRYLSRRILYLIPDLFRNKNKLLPPLGMIFTGVSNFKKQGVAWVDFFIKNGWLKTDSSVLDVGSGIGRIAIPLTGFLKGDYHGFDPVKQGVNWCKRNISSRFPNFQFQHIELFNDLYTSSGKPSDSFEFPYQNNYFDFVCVLSVFTHLLHPEVEHYFGQISRVIKKDGILAATFFLMDDESLSHMEMNRKFYFSYRNGNSWFMNKSVKSANVAYDRTWVEGLIQKSGFQIVREIPGHWCGREQMDYLAFQDILILRRK